MLIGYNNDVQYRGKTFHIQTEDRGNNDDSIETQLFSGGQILDTKITSYREMVEGLDEEERNKRVKALMQASHKSLYKKLLAGEYNALVGLEPVEGAVDEELADFTPGQDRVPEAARLVEEGVSDAFPESHAAQDHMDLSALKSRLANLAGGAADTASDAPEAAAGEGRKLTSSTSPGTKKPAARIGTRSGILSAPAATSTTAAAAPTPRTTVPSGATPAATLELPRTGVRAWTGCEPPAEDLSLTRLVEAFFA